ncbi:MAG TPA: CDP-alcohol phosphatidyltransferase family protein [Anaerolineae bacterium]|nr:CDP-alcohol phosphatidyltransferase family protein [Anaerolineae bacterium]
MSSIDQKARDISRPTLEAIARNLAKWNISPDAVTYLGLVLTVGVAVLAALGEIRWAGVAYVVAAVCDALDGTLARVSGKGSRFGAFLDSSIDRFEESIVFLGLSIHYALVGGLWEIPLLLVVTVGSLMVSYTRARAEGLGVACKVGFMTRVPRVAIMIVGMILDQVFIALILLAVTTLYTTFHRMIHVWRLTGGEAGGWGAVKEPFVLPYPSGAEEQRSEEVRDTQ